MKDLQQAMSGAMRDVGRQRPAHQNYQAESIMTELISQLKSIKPAWRQALSTTEDVRAWKRQMLQALVENGISTIEQISRGMTAARADKNPWWPSVGQVIDWCNNASISDAEISEAFMRLISAKPAKTDAEYAARNSCGYACRTQLPRDKALALFGSELRRFLEMDCRGEPIPRMNTKMLANPNAPSARDSIEEKIRRRMSGEVEITDLERRLLSIKKDNRTGRKIEFVRRGSRNDD